MRKIFLSLLVLPSLLLAAPGRVMLAPGESEPGSEGLTEIVSGPHRIMVAPSQEELCSKELAALSANPKKIIRAPGEQECCEGLTSEECDEIQEEVEIVFDDEDRDDDEGEE